MKKMSETIVFFGSGPVAAASLALLQGQFAIEAVVTKPRPAHHKGPVPVLELAERLHLPVYTATDKKTLDQLFDKANFKSSTAILIDFGIIVSQSVIDYFPKGIINSHFSLLPEWRGADPITFAILSGQTRTGVSLMLLVAGMDEGPLLAQSPFFLTEQTTTPQLTEELIELSFEMLCLIVPKYLDGSIAPHVQDPDAPITYSRKLTKEDGILDWRKPAAQLEREVRAFIEWPRSRATFGKLEVTITQAHVVAANGTVGTTDVTEKTPIVYCSDAALALDRLKPAGKKEMTGEAFLAGYKKAFLEN